MTPALGRLLSMPLREIWPHEAKDFTPWLAQPENLSLLAETLRLRDLRVEGTEVPVGDFSIDLLARDGEDRAVVVENQFGLTDHRHLGQILTYVAGQDGQATVVWIAETIREEHRAAIDWLNASTVNGFDFFAVKIEALRIGASPPAPMFNIVAKPNDWSRGVSRAARTGAPAPADDRQKRYIAYWSRFAAFLQQRNEPFRVGEPPPRDYWCGFSIGRSGFRLGAMATFGKAGLGVALSIGHRAAMTAFGMLLAERDRIEADFGGPLEWRRLNKGCQIEVSQPGLMKESEDRQFEWLLEQLHRFSRVFTARVRELELDSVVEADTLSNTMVSSSPSDEAAAG